MSLVVSVLLARMLEPADVGLYFLAFSLVSAAALIAQLGLNRSVVRLIASPLAASQPDVAARKARAVLRLGSAGAIVVGAMLLGLGDHIVRVLEWPTPLADLLGWVSIWAAALAMVTLEAEVFRGYHDIRNATLFGGLATNTFMVGALLIVWLTQAHGFSAGAAVQVTAFVSSSVAAIGFWKLRRTIACASSPLWDSMPEVIRESWPLFIGSIAAFVITQVDLWIVGKYRPQEEVALYGAAARLVLLVTTPLVIANAVIPPLITELHTLNRMEQLQRLLRAVGAITSAPMLLALAVLMLLAAPILALVYGDFYRNGASLLVILSSGAVALSLLGPSGMVLTMTGHRMTILFITLIASGLVVLLAIWLVQAEGAVGVAVATAIGSSVQFVALWIAARLRVGVWTHPGILQRQHIRLAWQELHRTGRMGSGEGI